MPRSSKFPSDRFLRLSSTIRARKATLALTHGNTNIGPLHLYGPYKERLALMQWAMRGRRRQQDQAAC
ncbi:MAG: hypothetical protein O7A08_10020 [SAR324 cluster bacterium]|nr:hypothetical protein [SAR324 cluster bacterium]